MVDAIIRAQVPQAGVARIRVGEETREWVAGKVMVFDDSFEVRRNRGRSRCRYRSHLPQPQPV